MPKSKIFLAPSLSADTALPLEPTQATSARKGIDRMKHVFLFTDLAAPRLYEKATGLPVEIYNEYSYLINIVDTQSLAPKTREDYCVHSAKFVDYCYEMGLFGPTPPNPDVTKKTIQMYYQFLINGKNSTDFLLRKAAVALNQKPVGVSTASTYIAGVNDFLFKTDALASEQASLAAYFGRGNNAVHVPLTPIGNRKKSAGEVEKLKSNSLLGNLGVIANLQSHTGIRGGRPPSSKRTADFPSTYLIKLIDAAPSPLYKCMWAMEAGGGLRLSETLGLQISHIDPDTGTIKIEDPEYLRSPQQQKDKDKFGYKGRNTATVVMFEPFKSMFFSALADYLKVRPMSDSPFLFISDDRKTFGQPLLTAKKANTTTRRINRTLAKAQQNIACPVKSANGNRYTSHSLRHFYGVWARNCVYIQGRTTMGLELAEIQVLMGHKDLKSTERYARLKEENIMLEIEASQRAIVSRGLGKHINLHLADCYSEFAEELRKRSA